MGKCKCDMSNGCDKEECRNYIDYEEDDNCILNSIQKNDKLTLKQVGDRLGISAERVRQLEKRALEKIEKLSKKSRKYDISDYI